MIKIEKATGTCSCNCCQNANYKDCTGLFNYIVQDIYEISFSTPNGNACTEVHLCKDCLKQLAENIKIKLDELGANL